MIKQGQIIYLKSTPVTKMTREFGQNKFIEPSGKC